MERTSKPVVEDTLEYEEGRKARKQGAPESDNPYQPTRGFGQRFGWFVGWYDENTAMFLRRRAAKKAAKAARGDDG